jgi:hypothetical protein
MLKVCILILPQEFVDARKRAIQNAPQVLFRNDPPLELQGISGLSSSGTGEIGYITFVLFPRHLTKQRREEVISHIQTFRDYFHYHIKASKVHRQSCDLMCAGLTELFSLGVHPLSDEKENSRLSTRYETSSSTPITPSASHSSSAMTPLHQCSPFKGVY